MSDENQTDELEGEAVTPPTIQSNQPDIDFDDIELPQTSGHRSLIELSYKKYFLVYSLALIVLFVFLFITGIISVNLSEMIATYGTGIFMILLVLFWLFDARVNS